MAKTVVFITFLFFLSSIMSMIVNGYFIPSLVKLNYGLMIFNLTDSIQFSYPAFNFFILFFSNKVFAKEVKRTLFFQD